MGKFSDWILFPGTAAPKIREGIRNLGFALASELENFVSYGVPQYLSNDQKARARSNIGAVIGSDVQPFDAALQSIAGLATSANQMIYTTGADAYATTALTAFARTLLDDANAGAARTTLGLGSSATIDTGTSGATVPLLNGANTWGSAQAFSALATLSAGALLGSGLSFGSANAPAATDLSRHIALFGTTYGLTVTNNALNFVGASTASHNWYAGVTALASLSSSGNLSLTGSLDVASGGTGAKTAGAARTNLGLGNVDNTSDANKPVSTAQQTALNLKANLASPAFTGTPTAPTQPQADNSTKLATTAYVDAGLSGVSNNVAAWVNFNGTGTVAIRASKNVSSITDNGVGDYTINFATALADANFAVIGTVSTVSGAIGVFSSQTGAVDFGKTTTSVRIGTYNINASTPGDYSSVNVVIVR